MIKEQNIWEQMEEHINNNLGRYGLEFISDFLDLKEQAEDNGMCPADTYERQAMLERMGVTHGDAFSCA
jgi:hypothetical protein